MTRTIVLSDAHGYPKLIRNALAHSGFVAGVDRLVFAGDFVDRGDRPQECLDLIEGAGARVLWGNHSLAVLFDRFIYPCSGESRGFRARRTAEMRASYGRHADPQHGRDALEQSAAYRPASSSSTVM